MHPGKFLDEKVGQGGDISGPFPQRRRGQGDDVQPEQKIGPETAKADFLLKIPGCGRNDAYIDFYRFVAAKPVDFPLFQRPQLRLYPQVHFADLVQQQRAAVRRFKFSDAAGRGAEEGAAFVTEEFAFHQAIRNGSAVENNKRARTSVRSAVQMRCDQFFPCTAFPGDQHGGVGLRDLGHAVHQHLHGRIANHHLSREVPGRHGRAEIARRLTVNVLKGLHHISSRDRI